MGASARVCRATIWAAALSGMIAMQAGGQTGDQRQGPVGTWLIEPEGFDIWLDLPSRSDIFQMPPWFPLLVIRADGSFTLYRLAPPPCEPLLPDGAGLDRERESDRLRAIELCASARERAAKDGFTAAHLHLGAAGRWSVDGGGRIRFSAETKGPMPQDFAKALPAMRQKLGEEARDALNPRDERETMTALVRFLDTHQKRMGNFFSTLFVLDGETLSFKAEKGQLELRGSEPGARVVFRAIRPAAADAAMSAILMFGGSVTRYYRCMMEKLDSEWTDAAPPRNELGLLAVQLRAHAPAQERRGDAAFLKRIGRHAEAEALARGIDEKRLDDEFTAWERHPAFHAHSQRRLGVYLGCPERDPR